MHNKRIAVSSWNRPPTPQSMGKLSSTKLVPGAKTVEDCCLKESGLHFPDGQSGWTADCVSHRSLWCCAMPQAKQCPRGSLPPAVSQEPSCRSSSLARPHPNQLLWKCRKRSDSLQSIRLCVGFPSKSRVCSETWWMQVWILAVSLSKSLSLSTSPFPILSTGPHNTYLIGLNEIMHMNGLTVTEASKHSVNGSSEPSQALSNPTWEAWV